MLPQSNNQQRTAWPRSVLIVGCGLMGTSLALRLKRSMPNIALTGVDVNQAHLDGALKFGVFSRVDSTYPSDDFDLVVLATPVDAAMDWLAEFARRRNTPAGHPTIVTDICSVKAPICEKALELGLKDCFAPTHPMAGLAVGGPEWANADLFEGRPWIVVDGWPAVEHIRHVIECTGGQVISVPTASWHDVAMASVSHAVHVTSLAIMLAYEKANAAFNAASNDAAKGEPSPGFAPLAGPGFQDLTRLSASGPGFWVSTLLYNRQHVISQIERIKQVLTEFETALHYEDENRLFELLVNAQAARRTWEEERRNPHSLNPDA